MLREAVSQTNTVARLKSKYLAPPKVWAGYAPWRKGPPGSSELHAVVLLSPAAGSGHREADPHVPVGPAADPNDGPSPGWRRQGGRAQKAVRAEQQRQRRRKSEALSDGRGRWGDDISRVTRNATRSHSIGNELKKAFPLRSWVPDRSLTVYPSAFRQMSM